MRQFKHNYLSKIFFAIFIGVFLFLGLSGKVQCAQVYFEAAYSTISVGDEFDITVYLDGENETLNAFEGKVVFSDLLEFKEASDGESIINLWVRRPEPDYFGIFFSGITPGGYYGSKGKLFTLKFVAKKSGSGSITFANLSVLKNDGLGTTASAASTEFNFIVNEGVGIKPAGTAELGKWEDLDPPENFTPEVSRSTEIFDNQWFAVFATQDKGSGIDHFEIKSAKSRLGLMLAKWRSASSPQILRDQNLQSRILIKAIDKSGNERVAGLSPLNPAPWYVNLDILFKLFAIVLGIVIALLVVKNIKKKIH